MSCSPIPWSSGRSRAGILRPPASITVAPFAGTASANMSKITVVNPHHWLNEDGSFPEESRVRSRMIRVAQCIEYGGTLCIGESRETLLPCRCRPGGRACPGFMMVLKQKDDAIQSFCSVCTQDEFLIYEWEDTPWARGPRAPIHVDVLKKSAGISSKPPRETKPTDLKLMLARTLTLIGCPLSATQVCDLVSTSDHPTVALDAVMATLPGPPTTGAIERFLPVLMNVWNQTPRSDLAGRSPGRANRCSSSPPQDLGRNRPCPCGSGKKFKRCCISKSQAN
jgi:SEC-C motif